MKRASRLVAILSSAMVAACAALYGATDVPNPQDGGEDESSHAAGSTSGAGSGASASGAPDVAGGSGSASTSGRAASGDRPSSGSSSGGMSSGGDSSTSGGGGSSSGSGSSSSGGDSSTSSGSISGFSSGSGTGDGGNVEAAALPDAGLGSTCGPKGTTTRCNANQVCCMDLAIQTNACAATCAANATLNCQVPSDCPASTLCCAHVTLTPDAQNDPSPKCAETMLSAACAASCNDLPPANGCTFTGILRLCKHDADCASDTSSAGGLGQDNQCWNYNGAPESWCTNATVGGGGGGVHQP